MILSALLAVALAARTCELPPPHAIPFAPGESLRYDVDVMGLVKAGVLQVAVAPALSSGKVLPLRALARNTSVFAKVSQVKALALSWVDGKTLHPERYRDEVDEDGSRKLTEATFEAEGPVSLDHEQGGKRQRYEVERRGEVLDALSTLFYLRALEPVPGREVCFDVVGFRRVWRFRGAFAEGRERVETPAGLFDAVRFDGTSTRVDGPTREVHLWFSDDARRLPVAMVGVTGLGPVRATLSAFSGAR